MYSVTDALRTAFKPSKAIRALLNRCPDVEQNFSKKEQLWLAVLDRVKEQGIVGMVLKQQHAERWVLISRDVTGGYRYTAFDTLGFCGHGLRESAEAVLIDVFRSGYQTVDSPTKLDQIAKCWEIDYV